MRSVRVYRLVVPDADDLLILETDGKHYELSTGLRSQGAKDASDLVSLCKRGFFERASLERALGEGRWPESGSPLGFPELSTPLPPRAVGKVLALGKNFREHAAEFGEEVPEEPLFFNKLPETLSPPNATVRVPAWYTGRVDHEAELAFVIGREGKDIPLQRAFDHVAGYTVANDLTARSLQGRDRKLGHPWLRAKNMDGFLPLGPCFVPRDFLDVADLRVTARVGDELRQDASTADWIVDIPHALAHLSRHLTLRPGDVILMGTPAGVGPLQDGDRVVCAVEGIGELAVRISRPSQG